MQSLSLSTCISNTNGGSRTLSGLSCRALLAGGGTSGWAEEPHGTGQTTGLVASERVEPSRAHWGTVAVCKCPSTGVWNFRYNAKGRCSIMHHFQSLHFACHASFSSSLPPPPPFFSSFFLFFSFSPFSPISNWKKQQRFPKNTFTSRIKWHSSVLAFNSDVCCNAWIQIINRSLLTNKLQYLTSFITLINLIKGTKVQIYAFINVTKQI